jgi:hypothetical protein
MMKSKFVFIAVLMGGAILLGVSSCATVSNEPLAPGEVRLLAMTIPSGEVVRPGAPYDVKVTFKSEGEPMIRRICFSWSGDGPHCQSVDPKDVGFGSPGSIRVPFVPTFAGTYRLECYAEYWQEKRVLRTNTVGFQIFVK